MKNVEFSVKGDKLTIVVDLKERLGKSASGKTILVASTGGNIAIPGYEDVKLGLNAYVPAESK